MFAAQSTSVRSWAYYRLAVIQAYDEKLTLIVREIGCPRLRYCLTETLPFQKVSLSM
jgi:hypothetical protein